MNSNIGRIGAALVTFLFFHAFFYFAVAQVTSTPPACGPVAAPVALSI